MFDPCMGQGTLRNQNLSGANVNGEGACSRAWHAWYGLQSMGSKASHVMPLPREQNNYLIRMLDHVTLRVKNYATAKEQYATALKPLGYSVLVDMPEVKVAGFAAPCKDSSELKADFWIVEAAAAGTHLAFSASKDQVSQFYAAAIAAGFRDNGAPGPRPEYHEHYYAAFVIDNDGNNIEAVSQRS